MQPHPNTLVPRTLVTTRAGTYEDLVPYSTWMNIKGSTLYTVLGISECSTNGKEGRLSVVYVSHMYQGLRDRELQEFLEKFLLVVSPKA